MWLPEYLGKEGNRLLKMIEEPPDSTLFLLVAERSDQILSTILSRCQIITVPALSDDDLRQALIERQELLPEQAATITYLSNGSYAQALTLVTGTQLVPTDLLVDWLRTCWKGEPLALVTWAEQFAAIGREPQKQYFLYALHYLRELLRVAAGEVTAGQTLRLPASEQTTARKMAATFGFERIATAVSLFDEVIYYIERNANPKVLFLDTAIRLHRILHHKTAH
jgi:DNA polymerase-3 subunit delta'